MNCLVLLLLVLCCGNQSGCGGSGTSRFSENGGWLGGNGYGNNNGYGFNTANNNNQCGCSGDGIETRNNGIGEDNCRSDGRNFIPCPTSNGGFNERQNPNDCDCNQ